MNMVHTTEEIQKAVDENYKAFTEILPELDRRYSGKYVLLRDKKVVEVFETIVDARIFAKAQYPDELFSIQPVPDRVADLGYFSHAMPVSDV